MSLKNKRIGVMMGGLSSEREISLKSGKAVLYALKNSGLDAVALEVFQETEEGIRRLITGKGVDAIFIAMHGGFGEDGCLQHILERIPVPFTGCSEKASRLAMDKIASRKLFEKAKLAVPQYLTVGRKQEKIVLSSLKYPLVVKPSAQGSSIGISFIDSELKLKEALELAFEFGDQAVVEEFIKGREITVSLLAGKALPIVEIIPKKEFFDFQAKYEKGMTEYAVPASFDASLTRKIQQAAVTAYRALQCNHFSRVDMIVREDGTPYVLEVNTIPGMTETSLFPKAAKAAGMSFEQLCITLVKLAFLGRADGQE